MKIVLELPHKYLKPNCPTSWRYKHPKVKEYRQHACEEAMAAAYESDQRMQLKSATVLIHAFWPTVAKMDPDNLIATMKPAMDGITDAGIWVDDRDVTYLPCKQEKDKDDPRIEIHVL